MGARFPDLPILHNENAVRRQDGGKPVGDNDTGFPLDNFVRNLLDLGFCLGIHRGCGLIQNKNGWVAQEGSGYIEKLLLPLGKAPGIVVQNGIITSRKSLDKIIHFNLTAEFPYFFRRASLRGSGISYIFIHASLKEPAFLQDKGKATPEILQRVFPDILSIQSDPTGIHIVKPEKQADNGSLS